MELHEYSTKKLHFLTQKMSGLNTYRTAHTEIKQSEMANQSQYPQFVLLNGECMEVRTCLLNSLVRHHKHRNKIPSLLRTIFTNTTITLLETPLRKYTLK